ncbi:MAG: hypothetical protein Fur0037_28350 [Planctomycetota bacterium]
MSRPSDPEPCDSPEVARLREQCEQIRSELARCRRSLRQAQRIASRTEAMALQSKRALLRAHEELRAHIDELSEARIAALKAAETKGRFLATMSHELRTPLNGMIGSADLLRETPLREDQRDLVDLLHRSGHSLLAIVNDILDYSRIEAGRMPVERIPFDLRKCVQGAVDLQAQVAADKGIRLEASIDPDLPETVLGDETRLRQILLNLVTNGVKFTEKGRVSVRVEPALEIGYVSFSVEDTGFGIPEDALARLFRPFSQADDSTTRRFGGTGLGLAICKNLTRLLGGSIHCESEVGRGSTFRLVLPLPACEASRGHEPDPQPAACPFGQGLRALIVDDDACNRLVVRRMLELMGFDCDEACDGLGAVERASAGSFDLVLMDCSMPVMDGFEAARAIRSLGSPAASVPILALTAHAMPGDKARCLQAGMNAYVSKPVGRTILARAVGRLLAREPSPG